MTKQDDKIGVFLTKQKTICGFHHSDGLSVGPPNTVCIILFLMPGKLMIEPTASRRIQPDLSITLMIRYLKRNAK
jgi:hypothetical protein